MNVNFFNSLGINSSKNFFEEKTADNKVENSKFMDILNDTFYEANSLKTESDAMTNDFLAGKTDNIHEVMITAQKSEIAISFVTEIRNKLLEAYQEFSRMQL